MILSAEKMKAIAGISPNIGVKSDILDRAIEQAEDFDIKQAIGNVFFTQVDANKSTFDTLLNGGSYNYNGYTYSFKGLNYAIAFFALSRWTKASNSVATAYGTVTKQSTSSDPIQNSELMIKVNEYKSVGEQYLQECIDFLNLQTDQIYNLYRNSVSPQTKTSSFNMQIIG